MRNASGYQSENERPLKNRVNRNTNVSSIKRVNMIHVLVVQHNGNEMYKKRKVGCTYKVIFFSLFSSSL